MALLPVINLLCRTVIPYRPQSPASLDLDKNEFALVLSSRYLIGMSCIQYSFFQISKSWKYSIGCCFLVEEKQSKFNGR